VIEITESLFLEDLEGSIDKLKALKALGVGVSIDDFGTGYSSLRYIARLPVDSLKIDRSFVTNLNTNPNDMAIVSTVIALAHALDLRVVAEGVETDEQLKLLRLLKCDEIQGYLVSRPVPPDEAIALADREGLIA
jgi:diguanylate cyclase